MKRVLILMLTFCFFIGMFSTTVGFAEAESLPAANKTTDTLDARLTHMLELNQNFDKDFKDDAIILENALISLNQKADDEGFIKTDYVLSFINNMYGYDIVLDGIVMENMPTKDGYLWVIPKGITEYSYKITSLTEYSGGVTAVARVLANTHDGESESFYVTVDFVENADSCFGYNIASCVTIKDLGYRI